MKKTISKKMEKMPSPNLVGSPKISVHWSVNSRRGQSLVLSWQLLKQLEHVGLGDYEGMVGRGGRCPHLPRKPQILQLQRPPR